MKFKEITCRLKAAFCAMTKKTVFCMGTDSEEDSHRISMAFHALYDKKVVVIYRNNDRYICLSDGVDEEELGDILHNDWSDYNGE